MRHELTNHEWFVISPTLPNKPCGCYPVSDYRFLNGNLWMLLAGAPWRPIVSNLAQPLMIC
jgi:transposase